MCWFPLSAGLARNANRVALRKVSIIYTDFAARVHPLVRAARTRRCNTTVVPKIHGGPDEERSPPIAAGGNGGRLISAGWAER